uniref:Uncharacterized protein n=1 Tax=Anguilla anguilla TaxID=7936 RepID=A0A0E9V3V2_ANGAN
MDKLTPPTRLQINFINTFSPKHMFVSLCLLFSNNMK